MKKFWNANSATAEIFIYGDITSYGFMDSDVTAKSFAEDLQSFGDAPVTVHINSGGGDVFAALAIANLIHRRDNVTVSIDGLAASAASLIAVSGRHVTAASNALMMIHSPSVGLYSFFDAEELAKVQKSLEATTAAIITTYENRARNCNVREMVKAETWLNAEEALAYGFVDEITGAVDMKVDDAQQLLMVNALSVSTKNFDAAKMRRAMEAKKMTAEVEKKYLDSVRQQELGRIRDLQNLKSTNLALNAIIDVAIGEGRTVEEIKPYVEALKAIPVTDAASEIKRVIVDQMTSGAAQVAGGQTAPDAKDLQAKKIAEIANGMI